MNAPAQPRKTYRFGLCEFDVARFELRRSGQVIKLEKNPMELLLLLLERDGGLVTRQEILERLWGNGVFVDTEQGINTAVRKIRLAIAPTESDGPDPIQTVVGKGYRLAAPVKVEYGEGQSASSVPEIGQRVVRRDYRVWFLAGLLSTAVIVTFAVFHYRSASVAPIHAIAVLPLDNESKSPAEDYFVDGFTDAIITRLARANQLHVISRTSAMHFKGVERNLPQIAQELNVDALVEGSVLHAGTRVRVIARLIDGRTKRVLWTRSYDRDSAEVLRLQGKIASDIADQVKASISSQQLAQFAAAERIDPSAYENYLRARALAQKRTPAAIAEAIDFYQRALVAQPRYAEAYAGLADSYAALGYNSFVAPEESFPKAKAAATKALEFDPNSAEALAALGYTYFYFDWNVPAAQRSFEAALNANPNYAVTHHWRSIVLTAESRYPEAAHEIDMARSLDPLSVPIDSDIGFELYYSRRYDDAIRHLSAVESVAPNFPPAHLWLGRAYEQKKMYPQAIAELTRANQLVPDWSVTIAALAHAKAAAGDLTGARNELRHLEALSKFRFVTPYAMALVYAGLNDNDNAFHWLDRAYNERSHWLMWLRTDPRFENLHQDARFQPLVDKIAASGR